MKIGINYKSNIDFQRIYDLKKGMNFKVSKIHRLYCEQVKTYCQNLPQVLTDKEDPNTVIWINPVPYLQEVEFIYVSGDVVMRVPSYYLEEYEGWSLGKVFFIFEHGNPAYNIPGAKIFESLFHKNKESSM
ncbi:MAG: hypothetical protein QXE78_01870 [Nitrososphaeria archaeon]